VFRRELIQIGNIENFVETIIIASTCKNVLRIQFLKPDTIGFIMTDGHSGNINYSKKALMFV